MEDVLDVPHLPDDPRSPTVCFDETSNQVITEVRTPLSAAPGQPERYDDADERNGVANLLLFFCPVRNWRHVNVTDRRTKVAYAHGMREGVDDLLPDAARIRVVQDTLNTHTPVALYEVFPPAEAKRMLDRLEVHDTPNHGSWLNMAESELSVLSRQCLDRRIPDTQTLQQEAAAWEESRNAKGARVHWRFTTEDARIKRKRLYPSIDD